MEKTIWPLEKLIVSNLLIIINQCDHCPFVPHLVSVIVMGDSHGLILLLRFPPPEAPVGGKKGRAMQVPGPVLGHDLPDGALHAAERARWLGGLEERAGGLGRRGKEGLVGVGWWGKNHGMGFDCGRHLGKT